MKGKICPKCNYFYDQRAVFCGNCGEDISTTAITDVEVKPVVHPSQNEQAADSEAVPDDTKNTLFSFEDRIKRSTYWVVIIPLWLIGWGLGAGVARAAERGDSIGMVALAIIFSIVGTWIVVATYVKRWHDLNMSGWMVLTLFIPIINLIIAVYLGLAPGTAGTNKYGEEPH